MSAPKVILASKSAPRAALLKAAGVEFETAGAGVDEAAAKLSLLGEGATPREVADALAELKAVKISRARPDALVIGADQTLDLGGVLYDKAETVEVTTDEGDKAEVKFSHVASYPPFELGKDTPVVKRATKALGLLGIEPTYLFSNGGLDANWLDKAGIPTITIGAGQAEIHTIKEFVKLDEYEKGCRLGILMATLED